MPKNRAKVKFYFFGEAVSQLLHQVYSQSFQDSFCSKEWCRLSKIQSYDSQILRFFNWYRFWHLINFERHVHKYGAVLGTFEKLGKKFLLQNDQFFTKVVEIFRKHVF